MPHVQTWAPIETAKQREGLEIRGGWFAGDPDHYSLELEKHLIWHDGAWRDYASPEDGGEWFPTHWFVRRESRH